MKRICSLLVLAVAVAGVLAGCKGADATAVAIAKASIDTTSRTNNNCVRGTPCDKVVLGPFHPVDTTIIINTEYIVEGSLTVPAGLDSSVTATPNGCVSITSINITPGGSATNWRVTIKVKGTQLGRCQIMVRPNANLNIYTVVFVTVNQAVVVQPVDTTIKITSVIQMVLCVGGTPAQAMGTITWQVNPSGLAVALTPSLGSGNIFTVNSSGVVTAVGQGSGNVVVAVGIKPAVYQVVNIVVNACGTTGNPGTLPTGTIVIDPSVRLIFHMGLNCSATQRYQIYYEVKDANGARASVQTVTFQATTAGFVNVDAGGMVSPIAIGQTPIVLTWTQNSAVKNSTTAVVDGESCQQTVGGTIGFTPASGSLNVGATQQLSAVTANCSVYNASTNPVRWSTSNASVLSVSSIGLATGVAAGPATITASVTGCTSGSGNFTVNAVAQPTPTITVNGLSTLTMGDSTMYSATVTNASDPTVTYTSSAPSVITMNGQNGWAKAIYHGSANICAVLRVDATKKGCKTVTVP
ncbi:Ig-like domain-containing protein [Candidatus Parcubacteria bacterium]|nr:Ig-like domain-containing protein [Candidatus Parcubacteria bacterium]